MLPLHYVATTITPSLHVTAIAMCLTRWLQLCDDWSRTYSYPDRCTTRMQDQLHWACLHYSYS